MVELPQNLCQRCVLSPAFPKIEIDDDGLCSQCSSAPSLPEVESTRGQLRAQMESLFREAKGPRYDCLVALSGGKDSTYVLSSLVRDYGLRCLALTIDNGFLSVQAMDNCRNATEALEVDLLIMRPSPSFMRRMYRTSLEEPSLHPRSAIKRASCLCNSCISLINTCALNTALEKQIPLVAGGYLAGQTPKYAAVIKIDPATGHIARAAMLKKVEQHLGAENLPYFQLDASSSLQELTLVNPLLADPKPESEIITQVQALGWSRPKDTGLNSSNCRLNDYGVHAHYGAYGFNPYIAEIAEQVRYGLMSRAEGLERAYTIPEAEEVAHLAQELGISGDQ